MHTGFKWLHKIQEPQAEKKKTFICLSETDLVCLSESAPFVPIFFLHKMYVTSFLWLEKLLLYMETVCTLPILLSRGLAIVASAAMQ